MRTVRCQVVKQRKGASYFLTSALILLSISETYGYHWQWSDRLRWRYSNQAIAASGAESRDQNIETVHRVENRESPSPVTQNFLPPTEQTSKYRTGIVPTSICEGATFCEDATEYPNDIIDREIKKNPDLLKYASVDKVFRIAQRVDAGDPEALCVSTERVVYPKSGETIDKDWLFIVNNQNFSQGVRIETCVEEDSACKVIDGFAEGYTTACQQKYIYRQLSAVAADGSITREYFRFPASCCCHVQFTGADLEE